MKTCNNMKIIVQNIGGYAYSLNGKREISNNTLANTTRALILNSSHKKEILCFTYHYAIWISLLTENRLCGDVPNLLWHGTRNSLKKSKYGVQKSTPSMEVLQERIFMIDHNAVISWDILLLQELFSNEIHTRLFLSTDPIIFVLMNITLIYP